MDAEEVRPCRVEAMSNRELLDLVDVLRTSTLAPPWDLVCELARRLRGATDLLTDPGAVLSPEARAFVNHYVSDRYDHTSFGALIWKAVEEGRGRNTLRALPPQD